MERRSRLIELARLALPLLPPDGSYTIGISKKVSFSLGVVGEVMLREWCGEGKAESLVARGDPGYFVSKPPTNYDSSAR
jgi:hypothetical protein